MAEDHALTALSPLDGRYHTHTSPLANYFSEFAFNKYRIEVEVRYLIFFLEKIQKKKISSNEREQLLQIISNFDLSEMEKVKEFEKITRHDVKAIEYYLADKLQNLDLPYSSYIHIGLTSEDTNSMAYGLMLKGSLEKVIVPKISELIEALTAKAEEYQSQPMLARTHGQPAVPTTLGKEFANVAIRIHRIVQELGTLSIEAKISGAVGNYSALQLAYPDINWQTQGEEFIHSLGLSANSYTTQIVPADFSIHIFQKLELINSILIGLDQDLWRYISDEYFVLQKVDHEVGSSTMPQKINPIDLENSEGNLGMANALLHHFSTKLPISRLQRDLSDSTVKRNIGSALGYALLGYQSLIRGLQKISVNKEKLESDLDAHWEVLGEGIQTILRSQGVADGYEQLKEFTRGKKITKDVLHQFIQQLSVEDSIKQKLLSLSPTTYLGLAEQLTSQAIKEIHVSQT